MFEVEQAREHIDVGLLVPVLVCWLRLALQRLGLHFQGLQRVSFWVRVVGLSVVLCCRDVSRFVL